jgi:hypothetical protein
VVVLLPPICLLAAAAPGLLIGMMPDRARMIAGLGIVLAAGLGMIAMTSPLPYRDQTAQPAITAFRDNVPAGVYVVTDQLFAAAWTGHPTAPNLVDVSFARISSGELTPSQVEAAVEASGTRAVVYSTGRLQALAGFKEWVGRRFRLVYDDGAGVEVWTRG